MGLRLSFLPNFPGATFIQGGTFIPDSKVGQKIKSLEDCLDLLTFQPIRNTLDHI